jgi:flagellar motility protein MotE (MotC chaperone)
MAQTSTTSRPRGSFLGRSVVLPIVATGLLALAPWQAVGLFARWQALAQSAPQQVASLPNAVAPAQTTTAPAAFPGVEAVAPAAGPATSLQPADGKLLEELNRRSTALDKREYDLQTWATQIAAAERLARAQLAELGQMRADLEKVVAQESAASEEDIAVLVGLYSNMKPSQAAALLGRLDAPKAAAILEKLDIHSAGPALAAMDPTVAVAITEELSKRHAPLRR